jgi:hypothetical protein
MWHAFKLKSASAIIGTSTILLFGAALILLATRRKKLWARDVLACLAAVNGIGLIVVAVFDWQDFLDHFSFDVIAWPLANFIAVAMLFTPSAGEWFWGTRQRERRTSAVGRFDGASIRFRIRRMMPDLRWRMGFGSLSVACLVLSGVTALLTSGLMRWIASAASALVLIYMIARYRKWNGSGWRRVHFRAMLAYASIAGKESAEASREHREFDRIRACRQLGYAICGGQSAAAVDEMVLALTREEGQYLAALLREHVEEVLPNATDMQLTAITEGFRKIRFGPQLIIANVIENSFGAVEAARYGLALLSGKAH